jgi:hypothetical protein
MTDALREQNLTQTRLLRRPAAPRFACLPFAATVFPSHLSPFTFHHDRSSAWLAEAALPAIAIRLTALIKLDFSAQ